MIDLTKDLLINILNEQFIPDHIFVYVAGGSINCFDGHKSYAFKSGEYFIARKNRLARYKIADDNFEPIMFCFDSTFLKNYSEENKINSSEFPSLDTFIKLKKNTLIKQFIKSLKPYYLAQNTLDPAFADVKYEELLIILLKSQPELTKLLFDFGIPTKIDLEKFMQKNYQFNVSIARLAFLTGRSLSAFKRDFKTIFNDSPSHWLIQRRLEEAYFLISKQKKKPSVVYLDLGFEDYSHFSFAFKKKFGVAPAALNL
ncbi:helix-turn-helix domain-containing protein [Emticicia sp. SJ17W-69]|uniref:helix-turn-helix domain-containing protein n=1 Tax=Emticicia sp. SJ17W-69 TaxID=3421657 RepID=UPI003EBD150D